MAHKTELGKFVSTGFGFKNPFDGWKCVFCIPNFHQVEEKVISDFASELRCNKCGSTDTFLFRNRIEDHLLLIFDDLDAVVFK